MVRRKCLTGLVALAACATQPAEITADGGADQDASSAGADVAIGSFQVRLVAPNGGVAGSTQVLGKVYDGPTPATVDWRVKAESGPCQLLVPDVPYCETPCGGAAACVQGGVCQAYPTARLAGAVHLTGVQTGAGAGKLELTAVGTTYQPQGPSLPYPAFGEGDALRLEATGSATVPPFALQTQGIAPLAVAATEATLQPGSALALRWTKPGRPEIAQLHVKLDVSHHGGAKGLVQCTVPDTGAHDVPAALVDGLVALGVAGFPTLVLRRESSAAAQLPKGKVVLQVAAEVELPVRIPGLVSCTDDAACPKGQHCQQNLACK